MGTKLNPKTISTVLGAVTALFLAWSQLKEVQVRAQKTAIEVAGAARAEALATAAPVTNACAREVEALRAEFDLERQLHIKTRIEVRRLQSSALVRRDSLEWDARELREARGEVFTGPEVDLDSLKPPERVLLPKL